MEALPSRDPMSQKTFRNADTEGTSTFMTKILDKVWPSKKTASKVHIAYAISVCEFLLNPTNKGSKSQKFQ